MKKRHFIFTNKKHSQRAIMSAILGIISLVSLIAVIYLSYTKGGDVPGGYGVTGLLITVFSLVGFVLGIVTLQDKGYYRFFPWFGLLLNLVNLGCMAGLVYLGNLM